MPTHTDTHRHTQTHTDTHRHTQTHTNMHVYTDAPGADPDNSKGRGTWRVNKYRKTLDHPTNLVQSVSIYGVSSCAKDI